MLTEPMTKDNVFFYKYSTHKMLQLYVNYAKINWKVKVSCI